MLQTKVSWLILWWLSFDVYLSEPLPGAANLYLCSQVLVPPNWPLLYGARPQSHSTSARAAVGAPPLTLAAPSRHGQAW